MNLRARIKCIHKLLMPLLYISVFSCCLQIIVACPLQGVNHLPASPESWREVTRVATLNSERSIRLVVKFHLNVNYADFHRLLLVQLFFLFQADIFLRVICALELSWLGARLLCNTWDQPFVLDRFFRLSRAELQVLGLSDVLLR